MKPIPLTVMTPKVTPKAIARVFDYSVYSSKFVLVLLFAELFEDDAPGKVTGVLPGGLLPPGLDVGGGVGIAEIIYPVTTAFTPLPSPVSNSPFESPFISVYTANVSCLNTSPELGAGSIGVEEVMAGCSTIGSVLGEGEDETTELPPTGASARISNTMLVVFEYYYNILLEDSLIPTILNLSVGM